MATKNKKTVDINSATDSTVKTLKEQIANLTSERDQALNIANYTASLLLKTEASLNNTIVNLAKVESPKKLNFFWILKNWRLIAELLETIWLLIKEFRQNIKFDNDPKA